MWPSSIFVDRNNQNLVYVTEDDNYRVSVFSHVGKFLKSFGKKGDLPGEFDLPHGVVVDESGEIYISDHKNNRIQVF
jgi:DNA-binding beta-propeller fold protein YncE